MTIHEAFSPEASARAGSPLDDEEMKRVAAVLLSMMHFTRVWSPSDPGVEREWLTVGERWLHRLDPESFGGVTRCRDGTFDAVWSRIESNAGERFHQKRGGEFTYAIVSGCVIPDRTNRNLHRSQFQKAYDRMPIAGPGDLQDLQGPSYLYAILNDPRVAGT